jgi:GAF domain-containing protein
MVDKTPRLGKTIKPKDTGWEKTGPASRRNTVKHPPALQAEVETLKADFARLQDENQRLIRENEQRATELQIINNIVQTLTEGLDLNSTLERVGERLREALNVDSLAVAAFDPKNDLAIAQYMYHKGERIIPDSHSTEKFKFGIRFASRWTGRSWVVNTDAEKYFKRFAFFEGALLGLPKSFVMLPLLAGGEVIGGMTFANYEKENAFTNLPIGMLETISSNMGTAIHNVRLYEETQRLLKETEQRATELQIINNIGQTLTEGLDLNSTIERVGER